MNALIMKYTSNCYLAAQRMFDENWLVKSTCVFSEHLHWWNTSLCTLYYYFICIIWRQNILLQFRMKVVCGYCVLLTVLSILLVKEWFNTLLMKNTEIILQTVSYTELQVTYCTVVSVKSGLSKRWDKCTCSEDYFYICIRILWFDLIFF